MLGETTRGVASAGSFSDTLTPSRRPYHCGETAPVPRGPRASGARSARHLFVALYYTILSFARQDRGANMIDPDGLLDIHEAARLLGVSATSLRRWTNSGVLPHLRIGGKRERRFRRGDLLALLDPAPAGPAAPPTRRARGRSDRFLLAREPEP